MNIQFRLKTFLKSGSTVGHSIRNPTRTTWNKSNVTRTTWNKSFNNFSKLGPVVGHSIRNLKREHAVRAAYKQNWIFIFDLRGGQITKTLILFSYSFYLYRSVLFLFLLKFLFNTYLICQYFVKILVFVLLLHVNSSGCITTHPHSSIFFPSYLLHYVMSVSVQRYICDT